MIVTVNAENLPAAAEVHSRAWQESHRAFCSADFIEKHTPKHQAAYLSEKLERGSRIFLLMEDAPVGLVSVTGNIIEDLYVLPERQNRGYGSKLLEYATDQCSGNPTLWILENNTGAARLYRRHGFRESGRRKHEGKLDEIEFVQDRDGTCRGETRMAFRNAQTSEAGLVKELYRSVTGSEFCTWNEYYPGDLEIETDLHADSLFVLERGGEIIGTISIVPENEMDSFDCWRVRENAGEFARVAIRPDFQGRGLSSLLVEGVLEELKKRGCKVVHISVAKRNTPAMKLYRSCGFTIRGEADMYGNSYYLCDRELSEGQKNCKLARNG